MKKIISFLSCVVIIITACNKKSVPIITSEKPIAGYFYYKSETLAKADLTQESKCYQPLWQMS
jgi:hypothetical protein